MDMFEDALRIVAHVMVDRAREQLDDEEASPEDVYDEAKEQVVDGLVDEVMFDVRLLVFGTSKRLPKGPVEGPQKKRRTE